MQRSLPILFLNNHHVKLSSVVDCRCTPIHNSIRRHLTKQKKQITPWALSSDSPRAKLLDLHNLGGENFTGSFPMVSQISLTWWPEMSLWCCLVHCDLSWYGSGYGSAGFRENIVQLLRVETKENVLKSYDFRTFLVAEAGLEPTTSGLWATASFYKISKNFCKLRKYVGISQLFYRINSNNPIHLQIS